jgi:hypothetical protein
MTDDRDEQAIREAIRALRHFDMNDAPPFVAVRTRAPRDVSWPVGRLALVAGMLLLAGASVARFARQTAAFTVPSEVVALSAWQPLTSALLETPTRAFLAQTRAIDSTLSASNVPAPLPLRH